MTSLSTPANLRPYRLKALLMGQTSPPGLQHEALFEVEGRSVADVGCGSGVTGYLLRSAWQFTGSWERQGITEPEQLVGIDWSPATIEVLNRYGPYDEVHLASAAGIPLPDNAVDCSMSLENLEHLLPGEVPRALAELARISRHRIVLTTPSPWAAVNERFLSVELREATSDPHPMGYGEFMTLIGWLHKSSVTPEQMRAAGFQSNVNRVGSPAVTYGSIIYRADPAAVDVNQIGDIVGVAAEDYPQDDGAEDWRERYVGFLHASLAMNTPRRPPAIRRASAVAKAVRDSLTID